MSELRMQLKLSRRFQLWLFITSPWRLLKELFWLYICPPTKVSHPILKKFNHDATVDESEMEAWTERAEMKRWWDPVEGLVALRGMNSVRVPLIISTYANELLGCDPEILSKSSKPLTGSRILDVGCGGGFLSEALAERGAEVTGIDMVQEVINVAEAHWKEEHEDDQTGPEYICISLQEMAEQRPADYDIVVCSEVIEHVKNVEEFVNLCCKLVRNEGCVVFTTINRTLAAVFSAVVVPEMVLQYIPENVHHAHMFVTPAELKKYVGKHGFGAGKTSGMKLDGVFDKHQEWRATENVQVWYSFVSKKAFY